MRALDFFFALRPLVLVPAWSFFVLGWRAADPQAESFPALRFALLSLVLAGAYLANQIVDRETDRLNAKGFFLQRGLFTVRTYRWAAAIAIATGISGAILLRQMPIAIALAAALGLAYSVPPLRLAARPGWDMVANAVGYGIVAPWIGAGQAGLPGLAAASGAFAVAAVFIHTTLLDRVGDERTGKRTIGTVLVPAMARFVALFFSIAAAIAGWPLSSRPWALAVGALALLALGAACMPKRVTSRTVCVAGTAIFAIAATVEAPWFGIALAILVVGTRVYYQRRFALAYPAL